MQGIFPHSMPHYNQSIPGNFFDYLCFTQQPCSLNLKVRTKPQTYDLKEQTNRNRKIKKLERRCNSCYGYNKRIPKIRKYKIPYYEGN